MRVKDLQDNHDLGSAFPNALKNDALIAVAAFPQNPRSWTSFSLRVASETVSIPRRIYHDPTSIRLAKLTRLQRELVDCLLTRHHSGFVRQRSLERIIGSTHEWVPPFVVQLVGEYVIEIMNVVHANLNNLDKSLYGQFLAENREFLATTERRVISYWNCYYRHRKKQEYAGFQILDFLKTLAAQYNSTGV